MSCYVQSPHSSKYSIISFSVLSLFLYTPLPLVTVFRLSFCHTNSTRIGARSFV